MWVLMDTEQSCSRTRPQGPQADARKPDIADAARETICYNWDAPRLLTSQPMRCPCSRGEFAALPSNSGDPRVSGAFEAARDRAGDDGRGGSPRLTSTDRAGSVGPPDADPGGGKGRRSADGARERQHREQIHSEPELEVLAQCP